MLFSTRVYRAFRFFSLNILGFLFVAVLRRAFRFFTSNIDILFVGRPSAGLFQPSFLSRPASTPFYPGTNSRLPYSSYPLFLALLPIVLSQITETKQTARRATGGSFAAPREFRCFRASLRTWKVRSASRLVSFRV